MLCISGARSLLEPSYHESRAAVITTTLLTSARPTGCQAFGVQLFAEARKEQG